MNCPCDYCSCLARDIRNYEKTMGPESVDGFANITPEECEDCEYSVFEEIRAFVKKTM